jgi:hypothetical protein
MKKISLLFWLVIFVPSVFFGQAASDKNDSDSQPVKGWVVISQSDEQHPFEVYLDTNIRRGGSASASIKSGAAQASPDKAAFLIQTIKADDYIGKRVRLSAYVRAENAGYASLTMRMEGAEMKVMNMDTLDRKPIKGTSDWRRREIVLDVPAETQQIVFVVSLRGGGQIWVDDIKFEEVGAEVPVTSARTPAEIQEGSARRIEQYKTTNKADYEKQLKVFSRRNETAPLAPVNLDFED